MAVKLQAILNAPIIELDSIDSTNNYAMHLIDADTAQPGLTIVANEQTCGKGQRGRTWVDSPRESLLMSVVVSPLYDLEHQFAFNMAVSLAISEYLQSINEHWDVRIKWPNDIIINDKKAGGILIENVIRGNNWAYSVIGLGLNVLQQSMPAALPYATSLFAESGDKYVIYDLAVGIRENILRYVTANIPPEKLGVVYNDTLYRKKQAQHFKVNNDEFSAVIAGVTPGGLLQLILSDGNTINYSHGSIEWMWA